MRISDWSSDVCSSDLSVALYGSAPCRSGSLLRSAASIRPSLAPVERGALLRRGDQPYGPVGGLVGGIGARQPALHGRAAFDRDRRIGRSEEHTSELQSLMRISYAVFCLKKKKITYSSKR